MEGGFQIVHLLNSDYAYKQFKFNILCQKYYLHRFFIIKTEFNNITIYNVFLWYFLFKIGPH